MKTRTKLRFLAIVTVLLTAFFSVTAFASEKLDQNMSGADMTFSERLEYALQGTATGMVMVFAVLALLWGIVSLSKVFFYDIPNKKKERAREVKQEASIIAAQPVAPEKAPKAQAQPAPVQAPVAQAMDDGELAAVITAAIAAMIESGDYKNEFVGGFKVVSFKRSTQGAWNRK